MIIINFNAILSFSLVYLPSYVFIHTKWSYNFFLFQSSIKPKYTHIYYHYIIIIIICIWFNYEHLFTFIAFVVSIFPNSTIYFYLFILIFKIFSIEKLHKKKFRNWNPHVGENNPLSGTLARMIEIHRIACPPEQ